MENKPEYRFEFKIVDATNGELVTMGTTYVSQIDENGGCESIELSLFNALRAFNRNIKRMYEAENYPNSEEKDEE